MDDYPLMDLFLSMMWFFLWILWFMLLFRIIADIFRDDSLNGWAKAAWSIFVILLPFLGVLVYLIARGNEMGRRESNWHHHYAHSGTRATSQAEELSRLADLKNHGDLTEAEYEQAKARVLAA